MEVKFLKDFRGKLTGEVYFVTGSVGAVRDDHGLQLIEMGVAREYDGWEGGGNVPPPPLVDPTLETKPTAIGEAAALIEKDNAAILRNLQVEEPAALIEKDNAAILRNLQVDKPAPVVKEEPESPKRSRKAKK